VTYLRRQLLGQTCTGTPADVVEAVAGLNAQTPRAPSVGLWTRLARFTHDDLDEALRGYRLVKANLMRGTVHMVTCRQYVTWRLSLQPMLERAVSGFCPGLWRTVDHDRLLQRATQLLRDHDGLTRGEMGAVLVDDFPQAEPRQLGFAVRLLLPVVQVADDMSWRPARTRYILAEQAFDDELLAAPEGLPDLVRSFLRAFGPASAVDAGYWSGVSRLAPVMASVGTPVAATGRGRTTSYDDPDHHDEEPRRSFVLPEYDNVYFCTRAQETPLTVAKKRLVRAGHMTGSLVTDGEVCAQWRWDAGTTRLSPWRELAAEEVAEFERLREWCATVESATSRPR
jgi:hypothetical protein